MEYLFGKDKFEYLRTKDAVHSNLSGFQEVVQEYPDCTITDSFRVVRHYKADKDGEKNCYDWYEIDSHYRMIDKGAKARAEVEQARADIDFISIMTGVEL